MTLSSYKQNEHVTTGGLRCPYCGSLDIEGEEVVVHARLAEQRMGCVKCGKQWIDQYQLMLIKEEA